MKVLSAARESHTGGAVKKVCDVDQYGASPMDGSNEDGQAGCTGNP
jgi:hypothetical protein